MRSAHPFEKLLLQALPYFISFGTGDGSTSATPTRRRTAKTLWDKDTPSCYLGYLTLELEMHREQSVGISEHDGQATDGRNAGKKLARKDACKKSRLALAGMMLAGNMINILRLRETNIKGFRSPML